ncbi:hypothetical protein R3P38DRAFT_3220815 [Favolaschia claudopus]|uniref:Uncharacterized protein n=1 Tax=Favolaschia claudopus TaxID=2862362 RepID=A0AAW0A192_9AGAR
MRASKLPIRKSKAESKSGPYKTQHKGKNALTKAEKAARAARLKAAAVKKPSLTCYTPVVPHIDFVIYARKKAARWALDTDVFIVPVDINELKKRPKNTKALKAEAAAKVQSMRESSADAMSGVFKDINGTTLACVFAAHGSDSRMIGPYPGSQDRAVEHYPRFLRTEENYDGVNQSLIQRTWEAAQMLHAVVQPVAPERDVRHVEDDKFMTYTPSGTAEVVSERAGVTHLVHCWPMQGHSEPYAAHTPKAIWWLVWLLRKQVIL